MTNSTNISTLEGVLSQFFDYVTKNEQVVPRESYLQAMTSLFRGQTAAGVNTFALDDESTAQVITLLKGRLSEPCPDLLKSLNLPLIRKCLVVTSCQQSKDPRVAARDRF